MANWNSGPGYYPPPPPQQQQQQQGFPPQQPYGSGGYMPYQGNPYAGQPSFIPQPGFLPPQQPPINTNYNTQNTEAMYGASTYESTNKSLLFDDTTVRNGFIRKVYSILMLQLIVTFSFVTLCTFPSGVSDYVKNSPGLSFIAFGVMFGTLIALTCCESVRRKSPTNIFFLGLFTVAETYILGFISAQHKSEMVVTAIGITALICFVITMFAFNTSIDFTGMGIYLYVGAIVLMIFGFVLMFFARGNNTMHLIYGGLGALLFSFYLIYDTQVMIGGKHKYSISPEEYVYAALSLYLDIIQIFLFVLEILRASDD